MRATCSCPYSPEPDLSADVAGLKRINIAKLKPSDAALLRAGTPLDDDQADALLASLRQPLSCMQGPPGTGK